MINQLDISQARKELEWRQPYATASSIENSLDYAVEYLSSHPFKMRKWRKCEPHKPLVWIAEHYLFEHGVAACDCPEQKLKDIFRQAGAAKWMPNFVAVQVATLRRVLKR